jgi:hypothetical protein
MNDGWFANKYTYLHLVYTNSRGARRDRSRWKEEKACWGQWSSSASDVDVAKQNGMSSPMAGHIRVLL